MKTRRLLALLIVIACGAAGPALGLRPGALFLSDPGPDEALCVLKTPPGAGRWSADFRTEKPIDVFHIGVRLNKRGQRVRMWLSGDYFASIDCSFAGRTARFGWGGRDIPPGSFTLTVEQDAGDGGALVVVADRDLGVTAWQIYSRALVLVAGLAGGLAWLTRRRPESRLHVRSAGVFRAVTLAIACIAAYLLLHEGGHALASACFGRLDLSRSDFFGLRGTPHCGVAFDIDVAPWQRAIESFAGPVLPALAGMALFMGWRSRRGRRLREHSYRADLFLTAICSMLLIPFALVVPLYCTGLTSDGDWRGFIHNVPGPHALVLAVLLCAAAVCLALLWRPVPHFVVLLRRWTGKS